MLSAFVILLVCQWLGEAVAQLCKLPVPGPVLGMILLTVVLVLRADWRRYVAPASEPLLANFSILFVPAGVGVMVVADSLRDNWLALSAAVVVCTVLTLVVTTLTVHWVSKAMGTERGDD